MKKKMAEPNQDRSRSAKHKLKIKTKSRKTKAVNARRRRFSGGTLTATLVAFERRGLGPQELSAHPSFDSESVEELMEEGQSFEAEVLNGIEQAADPDQSEVATREVVEDDVPAEYSETG